MKQEDVRRHAQNLTESLKLNPTAQTGDSEVEAAVCKIIEAILPRLEGGQGKKQLLQNLGQLTEWIDKMPQSLHPESRWNPGRVQRRSLRPHGAAGRKVR